MARITTLTAMKNYVRGVLGEPVIVVEMADSQVERCIEDAVQIYQKYNTGEGNYMDYLLLSLSANVSAYDASDMNLAATVDLDLTNTNDGINLLFTETHNILWRDWVLHGNYPGGPGNGGTTGEGTILAGYFISTNYLEDIRDTFSGFYYAQYSDARREILVSPTPTATGVGLMMVYKKEQAANLYNNDVVKRLSVALAKIQWGSMLGKYTMNLPGGATINGADIKADGKEEKQEIMEQLLPESEPPIIFIE